MKEYQLGIYEKALPADLAWRDRLEIAKEAGFDFMELSIDESATRLARLDAAPQAKRDLLQVSRESGLSLRSICLSGHRRFPLGSKDPAIRKRGMEIAFKAVDLAYDLGIRLIQVAGYDVYYEVGDSETEKMFAENLQKFVLYAARKEVALGFETMETAFMDTVEKAMHYVKVVNNPWLGVYPDIGNLKNASLLYGKTVNEDLRTGAGHLFASHLKETLPGKYREIPFGTGHTDFVENIKCLKDLGVRSFVGEFWDVGSENWLEDVRFANQFLRDKLERIF